MHGLSPTALLGHLLYCCMQGSRQSLCTQPIDKPKFCLPLCTCLDRPTVWIAILTMSAQNGTSHAGYNTSLRTWAVGPFGIICEGSKF